MSERIHYCIVLSLQSYDPGTYLIFLIGLIRGKAGFPIFISRSLASASRWSIFSLRREMGKRLFLDSGLDDPKPFRGDLGDRGARGDLGDDLGDDFGDAFAFGGGIPSP